jgi:uncharacterized protein (TIGR03083 family)
MEVWDIVLDGRTELADLLDTLTPEEWDAPTLCEHWRVRDVTAHLVQGATLSTGQILGKAVRYGFRIDTMLEREARKLGDSPPDQLARSLRENAGSRSLPPGVKATNVAIDVFVHTQDIRRPLAKPCEYPEERLRAVADAESAMNIGFPAKKRIAGLKLRATDVDWTHGDGPEVTGPAEALIMAMGGRGAALADLSGNGLATLTARLEA